MRLTVTITVREEDKAEDTVLQDKRQPGHLTDVRSQFRLGC